MNGKIYLYKDLFSTDERVLVESGSLKATIFKYSTGVEAVTIKNDKGSATVLPYMGQQVWRAEFLGHDLTMKSIYSSPSPFSLLESPSVFLGVKIPTAHR